MSTKCSLCKGGVLLGEGGVQAVDHEVGCAQLLEVEWVEEDGTYPNIPGLDPDAHSWAGEPGA